MDQDTQKFYLDKVSNFYQSKLSQKNKQLIIIMKDSRLSESDNRQSRYDANVGSTSEWPTTD